MALPATAGRWGQQMDPADLVDYLANLRGDKPLLEASEDVASYTLALTPEAALVGVEIVNSAGYEPSIVDNGSKIRTFFQVAPEMRDDPIFDSPVAVGVVYTVVTTSNPPRRRQRTLVLEIAQQ